MKVTEAYKEWSRIYDSNDNLTRDLDQSVLPQILTDIKNKYIVEAGCGTGKNTVWFAEQAHKVVAFDLSDEMLELARQKVSLKNVEFIRHDILKRWPVHNSVADIVSINLVLEHIPVIDFPLREAYRVLNKGGILSVCELHPQKHIAGSQAKYFDKTTNTEMKVESYLHTREEFTDSGKRAGFTETKIQEWYDAINKEIPRLISLLLLK